MLKNTTLIVSFHYMKVSVASQQIPAPMHHISGPLLTGAGFPWYPCLMFPRRHPVVPLLQTIHQPGICYAFTYFSAFKHSVLLSTSYLSSPYFLFLSLKIKLPQDFGILSCHKTSEFFYTVGRNSINNIIHIKLCN